MVLDPRFGEPDLQKWTIRLKFSKTTIVLHVDQYDSLDKIRQGLLAVLKEIHPDGIFYGHKIPQDASDLLLAKPVDIYDHTKGWTELQADDASYIPDDESNSKKKGKVEGKPGDATLKGAGIRDNAVLAFRFKSDDEDEGLGLEDQQWDVVIPTFEDTTGTTNEGDVGGIPTFKG